MAEGKAAPTDIAPKREVPGEAAETSVAKKQCQGDKAPGEKRESAAASSAPSLGASLAPPSAPGRKKEGFALQGHSSLDFTQWTLSSNNARNKYGNLNWNLRAPQYDGNVFNFHELPSMDSQGDPWSTIAWEVKGDTFEGAPADKVKVTFEISEAQARTIERFDQSLISLIEQQSMEVMNQKTPVKREAIATHHYKSGLAARTEKSGPTIRMNFVVRSADPRRLGIFYYYKLRDDGETYENKPVIARGWPEIEPLIEGHNLRGGKMRATVVRFWSISCLRKEIYPTMEIREMHVREPRRHGITYTGPTPEEQAIMVSME